VARKDIAANLKTNGGLLQQNSVVTTAWDPLLNEWSSRPRRVRMTNNGLSRRHARRMSRSFAGVGVTIDPVRLREIAAGALFASGELAEVKFALIATETLREERHAKFLRGRRRCVRWLLVAGLIVAGLNLLVSLAYVIFMVLQQSGSY
jgi:hypothetical protein